MLEFIVPALQNLLTIENLIWINLGVFIGSVFAAIPGLTVILCIILFLPFTYQMTAIPGMMFLLGIYCAGGYGGSVSAILINTPGTPHAAATMLDGYPLNQQGRTKAALKIALYASTFGGIFSALMLLFLAPQVAKVAAMLGTAEYFLVCLFGLTIIAGISGDSLSKGVMAGLGLLVSCIGADPMTSRARLTFGVERLYLGLDLAICLIGLFALVQVMTKAERKEDRLILDTSKIGDGLDITKEEKKRMLRPMLVSSIIGTIIGIIPGTGASMASWFSYDRARSMSKHPEEFGKGSVEGIAAAESANNAVTGGALIPLLTLGVPGDVVTAIMLGALMIQGMTPGPLLFQEQGTLVYSIFIALFVSNVFMLLLGYYAVRLFAKVVLIPGGILMPLVTTLCVVGGYALNNSNFDLAVMAGFGLLGYIMTKARFPLAPLLLAMILSGIIETNFRRALSISNQDFSVFFTRPVCASFLAISLFILFNLLWKEWKKYRAASAA